MTTSGTVIATIGGGRRHRRRGQPQRGSTSTDNTVTWDVTAPTVTINQAVGQADPTNASPINFTVVFSEAVDRLRHRRRDRSRGTAGGTLTGTVTGAGTTYNVAVTGMTDVGTVIATDRRRRGHRPRGQRQRRFHLDRQHRHLGQRRAHGDHQPGGGQADPTNTSPINFTVVFSEAVTDFATGDVTLARHRGRAPRPAPSAAAGTTYNVAVTGMTDLGTVIATIAAGPGDRRRRQRQRRLDHDRQHGDLRRHRAHGDHQPGGRPGRPDRTPARSTSRSSSASP